MTNPTGEMPFLDHLEELRRRILWSLAAVVAGFGIGWVVTRHFELIQKIEGPIVPFVPGGKLTVLTPTDPFMITLKFSLILGLVLASPFVLYQLWLFLAPALTSREKRSILPALGIGVVLFLGGALAGWYAVVPPAVRWLLQFDQGTFTTQITYDSYMSLLINLLVGMGVSAELPLVMILLASLGILSYRTYKRFRRYAVFLAFVGGAILSPTPEVVMMCLFTAPLLLLFEIGVAGAWLIDRRRARAARLMATGGMVVLAMLLATHRASAQFPTQQQPVRPGARLGNPRVSGQGLHSIDSATARRLGLPSAPNREFPSPDSIMQMLLDRKGFSSTRFVADSADLDAPSRRILLNGHAATDRAGAILQAERISYDDPNCAVVAEGSPQMFQQGQAPMVAVTMRFNPCTDRGMIGTAYTSFNELNSNWFMRGNLAVDSSGKRLYAGKSQFTSCDLPDPHYHFVAGEVKWVAQSVIVARPAVLYIRDVPVAWLPFIFQDTKPGRRSGILIPRFGFNDIVRTNRTYNRTISNVGYYWAPNDYIDVTGRLDWYSNRYTQYSGELRYDWLGRFIRGDLAVGEQIQSDGADAKKLHWDHTQNFNVSTSINLSVNYTSSSTVVQNNAIDPLQSTRQVYSSLAFNKRFAAGTFTLGGTRAQSLSDGSGTMTLPSLTLTPKSIAITHSIAWSPTVTMRNDLTFSQPLPPETVFGSAGIDTVPVTGHGRTSVISLSTPFDFGGFTLNSSVQYTDQNVVQRTTGTERILDPVTGDSVNVATVRGGRFQSGLDWATAFNLPVMLRGSWKITPTIGVSNVIDGSPFFVRTTASGGNWVAQGKKLLLGLSSAPSFFGFINRGIGPFQRFRYTLAPLIQMQYSPKASVSEAYATALGTTANLQPVPATSRASITVHQTLEAKARPAASDTTTDPIQLASRPKKELLSISTSPISYDFEQAKLPGHTGWTTQALTNTLQSGLLQGLQLSMTHDLWQGQAGSDTARFSPFLSNLNATLQVSGHTFHAIAAFLGLARRDSGGQSGPGVATTSPLVAAQPMSVLNSNTAYGPPMSRGFSASFSYSLSRQRPFGSTAEPVPTEPTDPGSIADPFATNPIVAPPTPPATSGLGITMTFSPTPFWNVSWNTQYDFNRHSFQSQQLRLERDLHDWRASFIFVKNPNGNFALYFSVYLLALPDIKFDYNQTTLQQNPLP